MADGDLITRDWQVELRGLLHGDLSDYVIRRFSPWAAPLVRSDVLDRSGADGVIAGQELLGGRTVDLELYIDGATVAADLAARRTLAGAWKTSSVDVPLVWQEGGVKYRVHGRPRLVSAGLSSRIPSECRFLATDPRIYTNAESSGSTGFPAGGAGFTFPVTFPLVFGAAGTGGIVAATNAGTVPVPWRASITGPWVNPTILHVASGRQLTINVTLAAGEVLTIDSATQSILLGGTASRFSSLVQPASWFDLDPGSNEVRFGGASGTGSALLAWRSGWL